MDTLTPSTVTLIFPLSLKFTQSSPNMSLHNKILLFRKLDRFQYVDELKDGAYLVSDGASPPSWRCRVKQGFTYCSISSSLSTNTSVSDGSLFPSRTETNIFVTITSHLSFPHHHVSSHFWALGLDWTSRTTVVTTSAYMSVRGLAIH